MSNIGNASLWTCLHHMVILRTQNKITDFLMILAWASPFNLVHMVMFYIVRFTLMSSTRVNEFCWFLTQFWVMAFFGVQENAKYTSLVTTEQTQNICIQFVQTDRQIFYWKEKSHYRLICHRNERDICTCIYKIVNLLKSYDNIHGMTYTTKIMLSGIAEIKTGYNINDYYLK